MTEAMLDGKPAAPSSEELISRAKSLIPLLRANAGLAERLGRLPDENVQAIEEGGAVPHAHAGEPRRLRHRRDDGGGRDDPHRQRLPVHRLGHVDLQRHRPHGGKPARTDAGRDIRRAA